MGGSFLFENAGFAIPCDLGADGLSHKRKMEVENPGLRIDLKLFQSLVALELIDLFREAKPIECHSIPPRVFIF